MYGGAPICLSCKHFRRDTFKLTCSAFPDVIPDAIIYNVADHRKPIEGDRGIQFEHDETKPIPTFVDEK